MERPIGEHEPSTEWEQLVEEGIKGVVENYYGVAVDFTPNSLIDKDEALISDDRLEFSELTEREREFISSILFREINLKLDEAELVDEQEVHVQAPPTIDEFGTKRPGLRRECVYKTDRSDSEDLYLHIIRFGDTPEIDGYFIAPKDFVL